MADIEFGTGCSKLIFEGSPMNELFFEGTLVWRRFTLQDADFGDVSDSSSSEVFAKVNFLRDGTTSGDGGGETNWGLPSISDIGDDYEVMFTATSATTDGDGCMSQGIWYDIDVTRCIRDSNKSPGNSNPKTFNWTVREIINPSNSISGSMIWTLTDEA